jgi:hypothetical protein
MDDIIIKCNNCGEALYRSYLQYDWDCIRYRRNCGTDILIDENLFIAKHFVDTLREDRPKLFKKIVEKIF